MLIWLGKPADESVLKFDIKDLQDLQQLFPACSVVYWIPSVACFSFSIRPHVKPIDVSLSE
jgi:hypothetical protein